MSVYFTISLITYLSIFSSNCEKNMSIYPTIHLSFNVFKQIHLPTCLSIYIFFLKSVFETPCTIIFFHVCCLYVL